MDLDGLWRAPEEWPEDYPPIAGWLRDETGRWRAPDEGQAPPDLLPALWVSQVVEESPPIQTLSRQAQADRRAMYTVAGVVAGACLLLAAAIVLIAQAGASAPDERPDSDVPDVVFAAETDEDRLNKLRELALAAPALARQSLDEIPDTPPGSDTEAFDPANWVFEEDGCLDVAEQVLIARSRIPIVWADQLECVPDGGQWTDRYLDTTLTRTLEADVVALVPPAVVYASGGALWSPATRQAYVSDQRHGATLQIVSAGGGHNPRAQDPAAWKPSSREIWCAYAVDWISVKTHWQLTVNSDERAALTEMLDTCDSPNSAGADPETVVSDRLVAPEIELIVEPQ